MKTKKEIEEFVHLYNHSNVEDAVTDVLVATPVLNIDEVKALQAYLASIIEETKRSAMTLCFRKTSEKLSLWNRGYPDGSNIVFNVSEASHVIIMLENLMTMTLELKNNASAICEFDNDVSFKLEFDKNTKLYSLFEIRSHGKGAQGYHTIHTLWIDATNFKKVIDIINDFIV